MQFEERTEKVLITDGPDLPALQSLSLTEDPQIQRTRKILLIILGVLFALSVVGMLTTASENRIWNGIQETSRGVSVGEYLIVVLLYGFGIFVAYRYHAIGLQVFACLEIISLAMVGITIIIAFFWGLSPSTSEKFAYDRHRSGYMKGASSIIWMSLPFAIAVCVLDITIIQFSFKLAKLIDVKRCLALRQNQRVVYSIV
ncbi:unnamed protein product [Rotaria sp. Silwood1]|nr:unnamed protein product [Rotaria sp. Silwood1]